jgi:hypothetical protein
MLASYQVHSTIWLEKRGVVHTVPGFFLPYRPLDDLCQMGILNPFPQGRFEVCFPMGKEASS